MSSQLESRLNSEFSGLDQVILFLPFASSLALSLSLATTAVCSSLPSPFAVPYHRRQLQLDSSVFQVSLSTLYHGYYLEIFKECFVAQFSIPSYYAFYKYVELYNA